MPEHNWSVIAAIVTDANPGWSFPFHDVAGTLIFPIYKVELFADRLIPALKEHLAAGHPVEEFNFSEYGSTLLCEGSQIPMRHEKWDANIVLTFKELATYDDEALAELISMKLRTVQLTPR